MKRKNKRYLAPKKSKQTAEERLQQDIMGLNAKIHSLIGKRSHLKGVLNMIRKYGVHRK